jgi:flagellar biosynthesis chaperone FliJ
MKTILNFSGFVNEAQVKDKTIIAKLERIHELKEKIKELTAETKAINAELGEFDASIKPIFDAMKVLGDKLAVTEKYVMKITKYGGTTTVISYAKAVETAIGLVDEAARDIINQCVAAHTSVSNVKHSYEIEKVDESKVFDKLKGLVKKAVEKFKNLFDKKISKIDAANEKLEKLIK